jgi:hypothetical protein
MHTTAECFTPDMSHVQRVCSSSVPVRLFIRYTVCGVRHTVKIRYTVLPYSLKIWYNVSNAYF